MKKNITITSTDKDGVAHVTRINGGLDLLDQTVHTLSKLGHRNFEIKEA